MAQNRKNQLAGIMSLAWQFVKKNGLNLAEALRIAWRNFKLRTAMATGIVKFYFQKVDGSTREAYGTLAENRIPPTQESGRKPNPTTQTYFDTEKEEWRCFKKANLLAIA